MYRFNEDYIFRVEYFGGILINRRNFQILELGYNETVWLTALEFARGNLTCATKVTEALGYSTEIDISKFINKKIFSGIYKKSLKSIDDIIFKTKEKCMPIFEDKNKKLAAPLEITIYPTLNCNLRCKFCFLKNCNKVIEEINVEKWIKLIREAYEMGVLSISILGGEPTQYKKIDRLLREIDMIGINITITSNGVDIKESTQDILVNSKHIIPIFSLQALNEKNKMLMGVDYTNTVNTISQMIKRGKEVRVNSVYINQSEKDFYDIIDWCVDKGIKRYSIASYVNINPNNQNINNKTFFDFRQLTESIDNYVISKYKDVNFVCATEGCMIYSAYPELENDISELTEFEKHYYSCRAGRTKIEIYPNGDVYPCICFENEISPTGNICRKELNEIWHDDIFVNIFKNKQLCVEECNKCGFNIICNSGCLAMRYSTYGLAYDKHKDPRCILH